jgi:hypothetical protein
MQGIICVCEEFCVSFGWDCDNRKKLVYSTKKTKQTKKHNPTRNNPKTQSEEKLVHTKQSYNNQRERTQNIAP